MSSNDADSEITPDAAPLKHTAEISSAPLKKSSYWLTRFVILRWLGFVYFFAFLSAAKQIVPLIGSHGLLPADRFMDLVKVQSGGTLNAFLQLPSMFWFGCSDPMLSTTAWIGVCLSLVVVAGYANSILMFVLWALYMSIVHVG